MRIYVAGRTDGATKVSTHQILDADACDAGKTHVEIQRRDPVSHASMQQENALVARDESETYVAKSPSVFFSIVDPSPHRGKTLQLPPAAGRNLDAGNLAVVVHDDRLCALGRSNDLLISAVAAAVPGQKHPIQIASALQLTPRLINEELRVWPKQGQRYSMRGLPLTEDDEDRLIEIVMRFMGHQAYGNNQPLLCSEDVVSNCHVFRCMREASYIECCNQDSSVHNGFRLTDKGLAAIVHWHCTGPARPFCQIPQGPLSHSAVLDLKPLQLVVLLDRDGWRHKHIGDVGSKKRKLPALVWPLADDQKLWYTFSSDKKAVSVPVKYLQCLVLGEDLFMRPTCISI